MTVTAQEQLPEVVGRPVNIVAAQEALDQPRDSSQLRELAVFVTVKDT